MLLPVKWLVEGYYIGAQELHTTLLFIASLNVQVISSLNDTINMNAGVLNGWLSLFITFCFEFRFFRM